MISSIIKRCRYGGRIIEFIPKIYLDECVPLVVEVAPGDVAEALGRGADLREDGVAEVVAEHGLVVAVGLAVAGGGAVVPLVAGLVVVGLLHQDQALDGHQHLYSTVQSEQYNTIQYNTVHQHLDDGRGVRVPLLALGAAPRAKQGQTNLRE